MDIHIDFDSPLVDALNRIADELVKGFDTLTTLGEQLVATVESIKAQMVRLNENQTAIAEQQAEQAAALNEQVTKIAEEVAQWNASGTPISDEQMTNLETSLSAAADKAAAQAATAAQHAADMRANTDAIGGIIPDEPTP